MVCKFCGNTIEDNSEFCFICGNKVIKDEIPAEAVYTQPAPAEIPVVPFTNRLGNLLGSTVGSNKVSS